MTSRIADNRRGCSEGPVRCPCCWGRRFAHSQVLDVDLVRQWELAADEAAYIDRQQGLHCRRCRNNLRGMALAAAVTGRSHLPLIGWILARPWVRVLEINGAANLSRILRLAPRHVRTDYPAVDMMDLPFEARAFDLVLHSDTLEHVPDPVKGLRECRRVLSPNGRLCLTIPMVVGRATRVRRADIEPSYHTGHLVQTEYGADAWIQMAEAGFTDIRMKVLEYPAAIAFEAAG